MSSTLSAIEAREHMRSGSLGVRTFTDALLAQVAAREPAVQAFAALDAAHWCAQADALDARRAAGDAEGALFGLPVGIKDIIDTADLPTERGTVLHAGRQPTADASLVRRLREAGGIVAGKTVTTELATYAPGKTRNPHDPAHTPGGSSSGSAAAVAAGMLPLAVGTQTNGSVLRPASFCGVVGFKPGAGLIARSGVLVQSPAFDAIGVFARDVAGVALLAQALAGHDPGDPASLLAAAPPLLRLATTPAVQPPRLAWVATPWWDRMAPDAQAAFATLLSRLDAQATPTELPATAADAIGWHKLVMEAEIAGSYTDELARGRALLSASLQAQIDRGLQVTAVAHRHALEQIAALGRAMEPLFARCDAIVTPAALGTAPRGLDSTGDPLMCTLWTALGLPAISLPLLHGAGGLPIGVQLVGRRGGDAALLQTAQWLMHTLR